LKTVRATLTVVKIGRCWKPYVSNGLMIVSGNRQSDVDNLQSASDNLQSDADHCRRASDYLLRDQENSRSHHENLLVRADHVLRNLDYCLDDSNSLHDDGDHRHGRNEDGVDRADHGLQGFVFISISILCCKIETALFEASELQVNRNPVGSAAGDRIMDITQASTRSNNVADPSFPDPIRNPPRSLQPEDICNLILDRFETAPFGERRSPLPLLPSVTNSKVQKQMCTNPAKY